MPIIDPRNEYFDGVRITELDPRDLRRNLKSCVISEEWVKLDCSLGAACSSGTFSDKFTYKVGFAIKVTAETETSSSVSLGEKDVAGISGGVRNKLGMEIQWLNEQTREVIATFKGHKCHVLQVFLWQLQREIRVQPRRAYGIFKKKPRIYVQKSSNYLFDEEMEEYHPKCGCQKPSGTLKARVDIFLGDVQLKLNALKDKAKGWAASVGEKEISLGEKLPSEIMIDRTMVPEFVWALSQVKGARYKARVRKHVHVVYELIEEASHASSQNTLST